MPPKDASKKKKRIAPQLIGPVQGAGGGPANGSAPFGAGPPGGVAAAGGGAGSSSGYKRLRIAVSDPGATVKQLEAAVKDHNSRYCVPVSGRKADLNLCSMGKFLFWGSCARDIRTSLPWYGTSALPTGLVY